MVYLVYLFAPHPGNTERSVANRLRILNGSPRFESTGKVRVLIYVSLNVAECSFCQIVILLRASEEIRPSQGDQDYDIFMNRKFNLSHSHAFHKFFSFSKQR